MRRLAKWVAVLGVVAWLSGCDPAEIGLARERRELVFEHLGLTIGAAIPNGRVLVVGNPYVRRPGAAAEIRHAEADALRGLKRGLGSAGLSIEVDYPELKPGALEDPRSIGIPAGATTPLSYLTVPGAWDEMAERHRQAKVWVSLIGVPADLASTRAWMNPDGPTWVLYQPDLAMVGSVEVLEAAFRSGRLLAVVLPRPGAPAESQPMNVDRQKEFDSRYVLLTRANHSTAGRAE
jgi:hypothetical protein